MKRIFAAIIIGILCLSAFAVLAPEVKAALTPNDVMPEVATNGAHASFYRQTTRASVYTNPSETDVSVAQVGAMPRAVPQSVQPASGTPPPVVYTEQLGLTFTQNFISIAYNVTAVKQADSYGYGPAYLLNGLSNAGYWYQVGLCWDWPYVAGGYAAGFYAIYAVFNSKGTVVFPLGGGAKLDSFNASVNDGDAVLLNLYFSSGNVTMYVYDWNTSAYSVETYGAMGATYFEGLSSPSNSNGFWTGLMTEWWRVNPYYDGEEAVTYTDSTFALSSAWMWADEWNPNNDNVLFWGDQFVSYSNPNLLQFFSTNGAMEASDAYEFVTGAYASIYIGADGSITPSTAPIYTADNITYTLTGNITGDVGGIVIERDNIVLDGGGYTVTGSGSWYGTTLASVSNVTVRNITITNFNIGIYLDSSSNSTLSGNNITANGDGVWLNSSSDNFVFHNNFVDNTNQVYTIGSNNTWDDGYPSGGNYWSDYNGTDVYSGPYQNVTGSDGIGDTPYVIDSSNRDDYPLMNPWVGVESLFVRGMDNGIYYQVWNGAGWEGWNALPGSTIDSPAAALLGNELYVVVRGSDGSSLWYGYLTNVTGSGSFSGWALLDGATSSAPTLTSNGTALCLVVRGLDNRIYYRVYDTVAQAWQGWNALSSGATCDKPAAAMLGSTLYIVVRGFSSTDASANDTLWFSTVNLTNNAFSGWTMLSGSTPSSPTFTASQTSNSLYLTVRGDDNRIYVNTWNSGNWQGWSALPAGTTISGPATTIMGDKLFFVVVGMDGTSIWESSLDPTTSSFSGWTLLDGATPSAPTLTG